MKEGPDIALIGSLIGDPARANMLVALMSGKALTASELALEAGITRQTASAHLGKLQDGGLLLQRKQGRHRYFSIADESVGHLLETLMGVAALKGHTRVRTGPKNLALCKARTCYDHLAGEHAVRMFDSLVARKFILESGSDVTLTSPGKSFISSLGIDIEKLKSSHRPLCKSCLDWSVRRSHLAGALGAQLLTYILEKKWAKKEKNSRIVVFTKSGEAEFLKLFPLP